MSPTSGTAKDGIGRGGLLAALVVFALCAGVVWMHTPDETVTPPTPLPLPAVKPRPVKPATPAAVPSPLPLPTTPVGKPAPAPASKATVVPVTPNRVAVVRQPPARRSPATKPPKITKPVPKTTIKVETVKPAEAAPSTLWYSVRVGHSESKARSDVMRDVLVSKGFPDARTERGGNGIYYVRAGDFQFSYQAEEATKKLEDMGLYPSITEKAVENK